MSQEKPTYVAEEASKRMKDVKVADEALQSFSKRLAACENNKQLRNGLLEGLYTEAITKPHTPEYLRQVAKILIDNQAVNPSMMLKAVRIERKAKEGSAQVQETVEVISEGIQEGTEETV
ncbi:hypothetical protein ACFL3C_03910 [Patescibacteria group bacterium]